MKRGNKGKGRKRKGREGRRCRQDTKGILDLPPSPWRVMAEVGDGIGRDRGGERREKVGREEKGKVGRGEEGI